MPNYVSSHNCSYLCATKTVSKKIINKQEKLFGKRLCLDVADRLCGDVLPGIGGNFFLSTT